MVRCKKCGYNSKEAIGIALNDAIAKEEVTIKLNSNGKKMMEHKSKCTKKMKGVEFKYLDDR